MGKRLSELSFIAITIVFLLNLPGYMYTKIWSKCWCNIFANQIGYLDPRTAVLKE